MVIRRSDRVEEVLKRDDGLMEVFIAASPVFQGLHNPLMRKTMGRLATVEQAAQVAGIDPDLLTERLNRALSLDREPASSAGSQTGRANPGGMGGTSSTATEASGTTSAAPAPPVLAPILPEKVLDLDVREDLRRGLEPFSRIMAARREVPPGGVLRLRATFEPVPLYAVMTKHGFDHWTEELAPDDWRVWFYPVQGEPRPTAPPARTLAGTPDPARHGDDVIVLDVRGMEPPEPMVHTLAALEHLPPGMTLLQINERVPQFLLPKLEELGFTYEIREQSAALVRVFIRHKGEAQADSTSEPPSASVT